MSVTCPEMARLFDGSNADRLTLLMNWLKSGENAQKVETNLKLEKEREDIHEGTDQLLTIEGMRKAGVSEQLVFKNKYCFNSLCFEGASIPFVLDVCHL